MLPLLRQTLRRLVREPGFLATAVLTLGLCLGANLAIYAVVDAILVRPLPFPHAEELVTLYNSYPKAGADRVGASAVNYYDRRGALPALASIAIVHQASAIVGQDNTPQRIPIGRVSPEFFSTLGVPLAMGRPFEESQYLSGADHVAILTDRFWKNHFGADPAILGKTFLSDGVPVMVIGVLPPGFRYLSQRADIYRPAAHGKDDLKPSERHNNNYEMIGRLAPGATISQAQAQIDAFNEHAYATDPYATMVRNAAYHTVVASLHADAVANVRPILLLLEGGVLLLLFIGGSNLVNLLLIRASGRAKEQAVRQALGAGVRQLALEVLMETVVLAQTGGILGVVLGLAGVAALRRLGTDKLPLGGDIAVDGRVLVFALLLAVLVGCALAVPIIAMNLRQRLAVVLQSESRSGTTGRAAQRVRHGFIVAQIGVAFVLLSGAGLLGASLRKLSAERPGFNPERVITGVIALPDKAYSTTDQRLQYLERFETLLQQQPGVDAVGFTDNLPLSGNNSNSAILVEGVNPQPGESIRAHYVAFATGDYWRAMNIPLLSGRLLESADEHRKEPVCVVDASFARRYWPNGSALGHLIGMDPAGKPDRTIVGVVGDVKQRDLSEAAGQGAVYVPYTASGDHGFYVVARSALAPELLAATLRKVTLGIDPQLPIDRVRPMGQVVDDTLVQRRSPALLAAAFAAVALLLATVGTYGVLAYATSQRRREIGVRMALGALPAQISRQFLGLGGRLLAGGLVVGLAGAWGTGIVMRSVVFGTATLDPLVIGVTVTLMTGVVLAAMWLPSQRAAKISPVEALRSE